MIFRYCVLLIADSGYSHDPYNINTDNIVMLQQFCNDNGALFLSPRAKGEDNSEIFQVGKKTIVYETHFHKKVVSPYVCMLQFLQIQQLVTL